MVVLPPNRVINIILYKEKSDMVLMLTASGKEGICRQKPNGNMQLKEDTIVVRFLSPTCIINYGRQFLSVREERENELGKCYMTGNCMGIDI